MSTSQEKVSQSVGVALQERGRHTVWLHPGRFKAESCPFQMNTIRIVALSFKRVRDVNFRLVSTEREVQNELMDRQHLLRHFRSGAAVTVPRNQQNVPSMKMGELKPKMSLL